MKVVNILFNQKADAKDQKVAGVEKVFLDYAQLFIDNNSQVLSIVKPGVIYCKQLLDMGSQVYEVNAMGHGDILTMAKMAFKIIQFKPDLIICHSGRAFHMAYFATFFSKIPIIAVNHGVKIKKFLKADYIISVSSHFSKEAFKYGKDENTSLVVPNMIDVPQDFIEPQPKKLHNPIRIGSLGRLCGHKQYQTAVEALSILNSRNIVAELVLAGEGEQRDFIEQKIKELKLEKQVKFLGWVSDKKTFFEGIDIFILPSTDETFGIVLLEAMLYKTPIITGDSFGPKDIFEDNKDALIIPTSDVTKVPLAIADAVEELKNNWDFALNLSENAYKKFHQKYSTQIVGKRIMEIINKIIKKND